MNLIDYMRDMYAGFSILQGLILSSGPPGQAGKSICSALFCSTEDIFQYFRLCCLPPAELSPGLAALTVGCDSGNLGSLSRVQLLLLDRQEPETLLSPFPQEEELSLWQDWSDVRMGNEQGLASGGTALHEKYA